MEWREGNYRVSDDQGELDLNVIHGFLRGAYWSEEIPREVVEKAIAHSLCFGLYRGTRQAGFARLVTDRATFAYLADVFVLPEHRGEGLGKFLVRCVLAHPDVQHLRRFMLVTRDAHGLYRQFGFEPTGRPADLLEITRPGLYKRRG